jgi:7-keto-8-aminopelargonate synthetase-like enzyme
MINIKSTTGRTVSNDTDEYLFFSGTSYLGITANKIFHKLLCQGMNLYGSNYPTSRISNVQQPLYNDFESYLSNFMGMENAVTLSSGFLAGRLIATYIAVKDNVFYAPCVHPSLWIDDKSFHLSDFQTWSNDIISQINQADFKNVVIVSNSLDSLMGIVYNFDFLLSIRQDVNIQVIIDDSHGFGVIGKEGQGIVCYLPKANNINYIIISSLAKAYGVLGGVILCDKNIAHSLKNSVFYTGSSAISPAYIYAFFHAQSIYSEMRTRLRNNMSEFIYLIKQSDIFQYDDRFPVYFTNSSELGNFCEKQRIVLSSFPYPKPDDKRITRIVINALHTKNDIHKLFNTIRLYY